MLELSFGQVGALAKGPKGGRLASRRTL